MLLYLLLLAGCVSRSSTDPPTFNVLQNTMATLPCPHKKGDVIWSRYRHGDLVILVTITNGEEKTSDKRYSSLADNSLVIRNVTSFDSTLYFCNKTQVYLNVTTPLNTVAPSAGNVPVTQRNNGLGFGIEPDTENQQPSDFWKVAVGVVVGVVVGAVLVLFVILTLRFCFKNRAERSTRNNNLDQTVTGEAIYEDIEANEEQPRGRNSYFENPYYWTSISEPASTSTPPSNNLNSAVNKPTAKGRSGEECVYSLAQNPLQTGSFR
ncbi:uncharacterized protein LOC114547910 [Perca flavescens]|uniref:uncharacterized protein LOC114547910 n=1 Tax=Perca flavescens TaxID=8167 RepID=UPI00106E734C|nr:uncharacterized protein LOC114547910 [Perca flavescens]